jgi:hypothetical protein
MMAMPRDERSRLAENFKTGKQGYKLGKELDWDFSLLHKVATAPMSKILDSWFESEPLKARVVNLVS